MGKKVTGVTSSVMDLLMRYPFPGNVRELENIIEHSLVLCHGGRIEMRHLPKEIADSEEIVQSLSGGEGSPLDQAERRIIMDALSAHEGNRLKTAEALGMSKVTLWRKMKKYKIEL